MKKTSRFQHGTLNELNITPLLDLAFVLLVIFIITTRKQAHPEMAVVVNGSDEADYQNMIDVLDLLQTLEITRVVLATDSIPSP